MIMIRWRYALHITSVNTTLLVPYTFAVSFILGCSSRIKRDWSDWLLVFYCPLVVKVCQPRILIKTAYPACKTAIHHSHRHTQFFRCKVVTSNACSVFTLSLSVTTDLMCSILIFEVQLFKQPEVHLPMCFWALKVIYSKKKKKNPTMLHSI